MQRYISVRGHQIWETVRVLPRWLSGQESACRAGDAGLIPGSARSPGERNGNPFQYSCLGNPMDRGAWWATVPWVTKESDTTQQLNDSNKYIECTMSSWKSIKKGEKILNTKSGKGQEQRVNRKETPKSQASEEMFISNMRNENLVQQWYITLYLFHWSLTLPLVNKILVWT